MGMYTSGEIFQAELDNLIGDIDGVKTYIDDILALSKGIFSNHIEQLKIIFGILHPTGLKVNAPKFSFWFKYIPYLYYVITR